MPKSVAGVAFFAPPGTPSPGEGVSGPENVAGLTFEGPRGLKHYIFQTFRIVRGRPLAIGGPETL